MARRVRDIGRVEWIMVGRANCSTPGCEPPGVPHDKGKADPCPRPDSQRTRVSHIRAQEQDRPANNRSKTEDDVTSTQKQRHPPMTRCTGASPGAMQRPRSTGQVRW